MCKAVPHPLRTIPPVTEGPCHHWATTAPDRRATTGQAVQRYPNPDRARNGLYLFLESRSAKPASMPYHSHHRRTLTPTSCQSCDAPPPCLTAHARSPPGPNCCPSHKARIQMRPALDPTQTDVEVPLALKVVERG
jgi:hypothetical protein